MAGFNGIAWFEIGTDDPSGAEKFYGDVFGWTVAHDTSPLRHSASGVTRLTGGQERFALAP